MENSFQTSFIPKKPVVTSEVIANSKKGINIYILASIIILAGVLIFTGGLFLYKSYLINNKQKLSDSLHEIKNIFNKEQIAELELYDKRVSVSKEILSKHIVLSPLFSLINDITIPSIQYTEFNHQIINGVFTVKMSGVARDYKSIALQAEAFNNDEGHMLRDVVFSNLNKNDNNLIAFDVDFNVSQDLLSYENNLNKEISQLNNQQETVNNETDNIDQLLPGVINNTQ